MNLREYEISGRVRYEKLAEVVRGLLEKAIVAEGGYRLQQVQARAKSVKSLRERLEECGQIESDNIEEIRKDLAGCRIVFYSILDVERFSAYGLLRDIFDIDWDSTKFHHPRHGESDTGNPFRSENYVVRLKSDRTDLFEYREFEGLRCEIQVQTSLQHAWAEMSHDIIYKRLELRGMGPRGLEGIEKQLRTAMQKYLVPADHIFRFVAIGAQQLAEGKAPFDPSILDKLLGARDNNDRFKHLAALGTFLEDENFRSLFSTIRENLKNIWCAALETEMVPQETRFGVFEGHAPHVVTAQIASIIERYRYIDPEETYVFLRDLYMRTEDAESKRQLVNLAWELAKPERQIWERYGPVIQVILADLLQEEDISKFAPLAMAFVKGILQTEVQGTTFSSSAITLHRGLVPYSKNLAQARRSVVKIVANYADSMASDDEVIREISNLLLSVGFIPPDLVQGQELATMLLADLAYAIDRMTAFVPNASLGVKQSIEIDLFYCWCRYRALPEPLSALADAVEAQSQLLDNIICLRDSLNSDGEFVIFKTIVGHKVVLSHQWEEDKLDPHRDREIRYQEQNKLIAQIAPENWAAWKRRLAVAAEAEANDLAPSPYARFLSALAKSQPEFALALLKDRESLQDRVIFPLANKLLNGKVHEQVMALFEQWFENGLFVEEIARLCSVSQDIDVTFISKVAKWATEKADANACVHLMMGAARRYAEAPQFWRDEIFFPCLAVMRQAAPHIWIQNIAYLLGESTLFNDLTAEQAKNLLEAMMEVSEIDCDVEEILKTTARNHHQMLLAWFGRRIQISIDRYFQVFEPLPHFFHGLHKALQPYPQDIIAAARAWYGEKGLAQFHASHFLNLVYPEFEAPLPDALSSFIDTADKEGLLFAAESLRNFVDKERLLTLLRAMLISDTTTEEVESRIWTVFDNAGMLVGDFALAQHYRKQADMLRPWLDDPNERVRKFADACIKRFERLEAQEERRVQTELAARKLDFDEPLVGEESS